ncbi:beta-N-acetylhexosaminidase [Nubsella zeaxanthinifaciens]|uniref:beta-N-acetylhexosaminidase n=1 Tax=Nubsella zeaxanthinifaciens TaxID=392412 RepID=UPI003CFC1880
MKKLVLLALISVSTFSLNAQVNIIPKPVAATVGSNNAVFTISTETKIVIQNDSLQNAAVYFNRYLEQYLQYKLTITKNAAIKNYIKLSVNPNINEHADAYTLNTSQNGITIVGKSAKAVFYGIQSLIQLLPSEKSKTLPVAEVTITDYPRFDYRGMHLDVSRHFFDVAFIKQYIDYLALHKMNYFHWHLTDDHGWRIEIKKYPKLTEIGAWRNGSIIGLWPGKGNENIKYQVLPNDVKITPADATIKTDGMRHGGFYTQDEVREVIKYAADRYITVIPEIEMPAHSMAALAAYPEFGTDPKSGYKVAETWGMMNKYNNVFQPTDKTFSFLEDVLTEVMNLFPSKYVHIGGDEASKIWWKKSAETQQIMKEKGIKDEVALQSYFINRIEKFVNSKGKIIIGWDEILDGGLAPNAVVMSWRGEKGGIAAAKVKQKVVMSPEEKLYLNHKQFMNDDSLAANKYLPLETVYNYEPVPAELNAEQAKYIWGAQGNLWSEYIANPAKVQYMIFPRMDALSEIQWSQKGQKNYADFLMRLKAQFKRYDLMGVTYSNRYLTVNP